MTEAQVLVFVIVPVVAVTFGWGVALRACRAGSHQACSCSGKAQPSIDWKSDAEPPRQDHTVEVSTATLSQSWLRCQPRPMLRLMKRGVPVPLPFSAELPPGRSRARGAGPDRPFAPPHARPWGLMSVPRGA
jgi:hypothetical protein